MVYIRLPVFKTGVSPTLKSAFNPEALTCKCLSLLIIANMHRYLEDVACKK